MYTKGYFRIESITQSGRCTVRNFITHGVRSIDGGSDLSEEARTDDGGRSREVMETRGKAEDEVTRL